MFASGAQSRSTTGSMIWTCAGKVKIGELSIPWAADAENKTDGMKERQMKERQMKERQMKERQS